MRPLTIDLDELACALNTEGLDHYLDLFSGKLLLIPEEDADPELEALLREEPERFLLVEPLQTLAQPLIDRLLLADAQRSAGFRQRAGLGRLTVADLLG